MAVKCTGVPVPVLSCRALLVALPKFSSVQFFEDLSEPGTGLWVQFGQSAELPTGLLVQVQEAFELRTELLCTRLCVTPFKAM